MCAELQWPSGSLLCSDAWRKALRASSPAASSARLARIIKEVRSFKQQITAKGELLKDNPKAKPLVKRGKEVIGKLDNLEGRMHNPKAKIPYDLLAQKGGAKLFSQMNNLYFLAIGNEGTPTEGFRTVYKTYRQELDKLEGEYHSLRDQDLARLNELARKLDLAGVVLPTKKEPAKEPGAGQKPCASGRL
jgi:hypothetical protein